MLERWIIASLVIVGVILARLLLRHAWRPRSDDRGGESFDTCMTGGCKTLRRAAGGEGQASCAAGGDSEQRRKHHASG